MGDPIFSHYVEMIGAAIVVLGVFLAFLSPSAFMSYVIIFVVGGIVGRLMYARHHDTKYPYIIGSLGLLAGYLLGAVRHYGNPFVITFLYILGAVIVYQVYKRKLVDDQLF